MLTSSLHEPWRSFLNELDQQLPGPTELHCLGGFVVAELYGLTRPTADIDVIAVRGSAGLAEVAQIAGKRSRLALRYKVYVDIVTVASVPENYEDRLTDVLAGGFQNLQLRAFERHDLVLAKLERNTDRDREDVARLAGGPGLDPGVLKQRFETELRWQLGNPEREALTLGLWIEIVQEVASSRG